MENEMDAVREEIKKYLCRVRLCRPVGSACPRCGRVVYSPGEKGEAPGKPDVPVVIDHGI